MSDQHVPHEPAAEPTEPVPPAVQPSLPYPPYYPTQVPAHPFRYAPVHQVAPKSPALALLVSFFIPGVGSMMNGEVGKGVGILIGFIVSLFLTVIVVGFFGMLGFWVWGMVDAHQGARSWNLRHGIVS